MPFVSLFTGVELFERGLGLVGLEDSLFVMVDVDDDRLKVLASGARCVSFSSASR